MARNKNKNKQKHFTHQGTGDTNTTTQTATTKMALIFGIAGLIAGALASNLSIVWTAGAAVFGALGGFFIGQRIDKAVSKK